MATAAVALPAAAALRAPPSTSPRRKTRPSRSPPPTEAQSAYHRSSKTSGLEALRWRIARALTSARFLAALAQEHDTTWRDELDARLRSSPAPQQQQEPAPAYEDTLDDAPPDYTASDALATARIAAAPLSAPTPPPPYGPLRAPEPASPPFPPLSSIELLEKERARPKVDFSSVDNVREHAKKKKKAAQKTAAWALSDDEGDKKKNDAGAGDGGDGAGGADGGDGGGAGGDGGGGDDNNGGGDDGDDWNDVGGGGKKNKKKKKGKSADEEEEEKKAEEEAKKAEEEAAEAATADAGATDAWGDPAAGAGDANPDDEWGGFTTAKSKKKKKGKVSTQLMIIPLAASYRALLHVVNIRGNRGGGWLAGAKIAYQIVATERRPRSSSTSSRARCS